MAKYYTPMPKKEADRIQKQLLRALDSQAVRVKKTFDELVAPWNHNVHFIKERTRLIGNDGKTAVTTFDAPFFFLDQGTSVRYAVMSNPFVPKTTPKSFKSGKGVGGFRRMSRTPYPGIKARKWTNLMALLAGADLSNSVRLLTSGLYSDTKLQVSGLPIRKFFSG